MRLARKLSGLLFLIYSPAAVAVNHNIFVSAAGECTGNGTAARPFVRLTDALAQVRALRASGQTDTINIHVAPGQYVVSRTPQGCGTEPLPIIINVSDVTILGATELVLDAETNTPSAALPGGSEFLAAQTLIGGEALVLLTPGTDGLPPQRVRVLGLSLTGSNLGGHGFFVDRAQDFLLQGNVTTHFSNGIRTRGASGELRGNLSLDNHDTGMVITAGSSIYPAAVRVTENRACDAEIGILLTATGVYALAAPGAAPITTQFDPIADAETIPNELAVSLRNNVMCSNGIAGLRVFAIGQLGNAYNLVNSTGYQTFVNIDSSGNHFARNGYGISLDGGFPRRSATFSYSTFMQARFRDDVAVGSITGNMFLGFLRLQVALGTASSTMFQPLNSSTIAVEADAELLHSLNLSHPSTDTVTGATLNNLLDVNGIAIQNATCIGVCPDPLP